VRSDRVKPYFIKLCYVSPFKKKVIYSRGGKVMNSKVKKDIKCSVPTILKFFKESVVKPRNIGPRLILINIFSTITVSGLMTKEDM
jgi:hypothetical protein